MYSILTVTAPASTYDLTTLANVKAELNVTDTASDTILRRFITSASAAASQYCDRVFASETVSEQFLPDHASRLFRSGVKPLQLMRWPIISVTSVTENSVVLVLGTDYLIDKVNGQLTRLDSSAYPTPWCALPLTVVYVAGFATTPPDVEDAVVRMVTKRYLAKGRDPSLKQSNVPGVLEQAFWIATGAEAGNMTPDIVDVLDSYRVPVVK